MVLLSKIKEVRGLGYLSSLLCTKEDPVLIESFVSQNVDPEVAASKFPKGLFKMLFPDFLAQNFKGLGIGTLH